MFRVVAAFGFRAVKVADAASAGSAESVVDGLDDLCRIGEYEAAEMDVGAPEDAKPVDVFIEDGAHIGDAALNPVGPDDALDAEMVFGFRLAYRRMLGIGVVARGGEVSGAVELDELRDAANRDAQIDALPAPGNLMLDGGIRVGYLDQLHEDHFIEADIRVADFGRWCVRDGLRIPELLEFALVNRGDAIPVLERDGLDVGLGQSEDFQNIVLTQHRADAGVAVVKLEQALRSPKDSHVHAL